jgi:hypothetical protein
MDVVVENGHKLTLLSTKNLHILQTVLPIVTLARRVGEVVGPHKDSMGINVGLDANFLPLGALDGELGSFKRLLIQVIDIHCSICLLFRELGSMLPGKQVARALVGGHFGVQRTELEAIKVTLTESGRIILSGSLFSESSMDGDGRLTIIFVLINLNAIGVFVNDGSSVEAETLVLGELKVLHAFLGRESPGKLSQSASIFG